ncbi:MAG: SPOR domain-containing protein [Cytophagaceae bacterium]
MVVKYIKELLFEHDCVVVPGFGGFIAHSISADIHPITHKFLPPSKRIAFNEQLKLNDGLLVSAIAAGENITRDEALVKVNAFVQKVKQDLQKYSQFVFDEIGRVFINVGNKIEFEPDHQINYLEESFGLTELYFKPIEKDIKSMNSSRPIRPSSQRPPVKNEKSDLEQAKSGGVSKILILVIPLVLIIGGGLAFFATQKDNAFLSGMISSGKSKKSVEPKVEASSEIIEDEDEIIEEDEFSTEESSDMSEFEASDVPQTVASSGTYHVVVGAFANYDNAMKLQRKLLAEGNSVNLLEPGSGGRLYKVTVAQFDSKEKAVTGIEGLRGKYGRDIWLLKY